MNSIAVLGLLLSLRAEAAARPSEWKAINYSPRGHGYFRMLYDWYTIDASTGLEVRQLAAADLAMLERSGFNALHLYLWDQPTFRQFQRTGSSKRLEPAGFSYPDPSASPRRQWEALDEFVSIAERNGLWVIPHFVHTPFNEGIDTMKAADVERRAEEIAGWAGAFIGYLSPRHRNILAWGALYALEPAPDDDPARPNNYSLLWRKLYAALKHKAEPAPLIAYLFFPSEGRDLTAPGARIEPGPMEGYTLNVDVAKCRYASMKRHLTFEFRRQTEPDIVYVYLFGPDARDIGRSLRELTSGPEAVPAGRLFVAEFAISAPFGAFENSVLAFGENGAPTTDLEGQAVWLKQLLCELQTAGIRKSAYWTLYDAALLWSSEVWGQSNAEVSLNGHWGLAFEDPARGFKPAWAVLRDFHAGASTCGAVEAGTAVLGKARGPVRFAAAHRKPDAVRQAIVAPLPVTVRTAVSPADFRAGIWYPGSLLTLFVRGLTGIPPLWQAAAYPLPFEQFGVRIAFQGIDNQWRQGALLGFANVDGEQMINVQIPWELPLTPFALRVSQAGGQPTTFPNPHAAECCGFFRGPGGDALAIHEETGELVTAANPARPPETVLLYVTGLTWRPQRVPATGLPIDPGLPPAVYEVSPINGRSEYRLVVNGSDIQATPWIKHLRLAPDSVGVYHMRLAVPPVSAPHTLSIYYAECMLSYDKFARNLPCLGGGPIKRGEARLPVAPAEPAGGR